MKGFQTIAVTNQRRFNEAICVTFLRLICPTFSDHEIRPSDQLSVNFAKSSMMQLFHPVFGHLWYLGVLAIVGLAVSGIAYERLNGNTSGLAVLGFTASIVHAAAWWFTLGVTSPLKKFVACVLLFAAAMLSAGFGRFACLAFSEQSHQPLLANMQFIAGVVPMWWLSLAVVNGIAKEAMRWRLNHNETPISPRTSLGDIFQVMAIVGVILAFFRSFDYSLIGIDYLQLLLVSTCFHAFLLLPLSVLIWNTKCWGRSRAALACVAVAGCCGLLLLVLSRYFGDEFERLSDVAVGFSAFIVPYVLMLLWGREKDLRLSSGWFEKR